MERRLYYEKIEDIPASDGFVNFKAAMQPLQ